MTRRPPPPRRRVGLRGLAALAILLALPGHARAQELLGRVVDRTTGAGLSDVELVALRGNTPVARTTSNETGGFRLIVPGGGRVQLEASRLDYIQLDTVSLEIPVEGRRVVEFILDPRPITLEEIRAEVRRGVPARFLDTYDGFLTRHETLPPIGSRRVVRRGDPEMEGAGSIQEVLNWFPPTRDTVRWFLDGRPSSQEELESMIFDDVEGVEFYRMHLDAPMYVDPGREPFVSVVMVWRRRGG